MPSIASSAHPLGVSSLLIGLPNRLAARVAVAAGALLLACLAPVATAQSTPPRYEVGTVSTGQSSHTEWHPVAFATPFAAPPIVVMGPMSFAGSQPACVRVRHVTATGFEFQLKEYSYLDGSHVTESLSYLAMEAGDHSLGGLRWVAARSSEVGGVLVPLTFSNPFAEVPVVLAQVESDANPTATLTRIQDVSPTGFSLNIQLEEGSPSAVAPSPESVGFIVVEPGTSTGTDGVWLETGTTVPAFDDSWTQLLFDETYPFPYFLAGLQSVNETDPAGLRHRDLGANGVELRVEEEASLDSETGHALEAVGYVVFSSTVPSGTEADARLELGELDLTQSGPGEWFTVDLAATYANPVVVAGAITDNDPDPGFVRVRNVTGTRFEIQLAEFLYQDGVHAQEKVFYLVMEEGRYDIAGLKWEAGRIGVTSSYQAHDLTQAFTGTPVILATTASVNESDPAIVRVRNRTPDGFEIKLDEEEAADRSHGSEEVHFVAIDVGTGLLESGGPIEVLETPDTVTQVVHDAVPSAALNLPYVLSFMQTADGGDPSFVRTASISESAIGVRIDEEASADSERNHTTEVVGLLLVGAFAAADGDNDGLEDAWEQQIIDADPGDGIATLADVLPGDDFDGDGLTNLEEQALGTDPTDAGSPAPDPLTTERVASGLLRPVAIVTAPGDASRLYIAEQHTGRIRILDPNTGALSTFIDIDEPSGVTLDVGNEQGLLGLAFHPDYATNGYFYVYYTRGDRASVVARYQATDADNADPNSRFELLSFAQPQGNHNAGWLGFGPDDGYLYISSGDGGGGNDDDGGHAPIGNGQDPNTLLGKLLRIDVDGSNGPGGRYGIPAGNPTAKFGPDEIWAYGLRNPWRCSFDPMTGDLYIGDVGQSAREEINVQPSGVAGSNYGWRLREGFIQTPTSGIGGPKPADNVDPVVDLDRGLARSITGGHVYRGAAIHGLYGTYFFADYVTNRIWSFRLDEARTGVTDYVERTAELDPTGSLDLVNISTFGVDAAGELYLADHRDGEIFKVVSAASDSLPVITSVAPGEGFVGSAFDYDVDAIGSPTPSFALITAPTGMSINATSGVITWTPTAPGTYPVTVQAVNSQGFDAQSFSVTVSALRAPDTPPSATTAGLSYSYYHGNWDMLPDFDTLVAIEAGTISNFSIAPRTRDTEYAFRYTGYVSVPADGSYTFHVNSDDGAILRIGGAEVVNHDGLHGMSERSGTIGLQAGQHPIEVVLFQRGGGQGLEVRWSGAGLEKQLIADSALQHFSDPYGLVRRRAVAPRLGVFPDDETAAMPALLSETGAFVDLATLTPAAGVLPYNVNSPLWSDDAKKARWVAVPTGQSITFRATGEWDFPPGAVFIKHFELGETVPVRLETRFLIVKDDGSVYGLTYRWLPDESDAVLLIDADNNGPKGLTETVAFDGDQDQTWTWPSRSACLECHTSGAGFVLGANTRQLNGLFTFPSTGVEDNQLRTWNHLGLFNEEADLYDESTPYDFLVAAGDASASLEHRVRSYLDANCAQCHQPGGSPGQFDARYDTPLASANLIGGDVFNTLGIEGAKVVAPGELAKSLLLRRMDTVDALIQMPPLARHRIDPAGVADVQAWIAAMPATPPTPTDPLQPDAAGLLAVEAEHPDAVTPGSNAHAWIPVSEAGATGGQAFFASPDSGLNQNTNYVGVSPRLDYRMNFDRAGTFYVWVRGRAIAGLRGTSDSVHVGLNGNAVTTADRISSFGTGYGWSNSTMDSAPATIVVPSAGEHIVNVWMREDGFTFDKLVVTPDAAWTPTDDGPPESKRSPSSALPAPWASTDVGAVGVEGSATEEQGLFTLEASGADIWGTADGMHFVYQSLDGDGEITARVLSQDLIHAWTRSGVMIRETLAPGSKNVASLWSANGVIKSQVRAADDATTTSVHDDSVSGPVWLRVTRQGDTFVAAYSLDGFAYQTISTRTVTMNTQVLIGLAATARINGQVNRAIFDQVTVGSGAGPSP